MRVVSLTKTAWPQSGVVNHDRVSSGTDRGARRFGVDVVRRARTATNSPEGRTTPAGGSTIAGVVLD